MKGSSEQAAEPVNEAERETGDFLSNACLSLRCIRATYFQRYVGIVCKTIRSHNLVFFSNTSMNTSMNKLLIFLVVSFCYACYNTDLRKDSSENSQSAIPQATISLQQKGESFNSTPSYKLDIYADGTVIFDGEQNTKVKGIVRSNISLQEVQSLKSKFEELGFSSFANEYFEKNENDCPVRLSDSPTIILKFNINGKSKAVTHYTGCEGNKRLQDLFNLENAVITTTKAKQWLR